MAKNTICLWYDHDAQEADAGHAAHRECNHQRRAGLAARVIGRRAVDRANAAVGKGLGVSWQISPRVLTDAMAQGGEVASRAFAAMMQMRKIDVAAIEAAVRG